MKVAVIHPTLNLLGGASKVCLGFIHALARAGYDITFFTVDKTDWSLLRKVFDDFPELKFKECFIFAGSQESLCGSRVWKLLIAFFYSIEVFAVRFFGGFDLVLVTGGQLFDSFGDIVYVNAIPFRFAHLFPDVRLGNSAFWNGCSRLYNFFLMFIGRADSRGLLLTNSNFLRNVVRKLLGRDSLVVYPPVDVKRFMNLGDVGGENRRRNLVVTVSRLHPGKSLDVVLEIARFVEEAEFLIISSVSREYFGVADELKSLIDAMGLSGRVNLRINEPFINLLGALHEAKVLLHAQTSEAFGMSVVEGMAAGCVPVVPRCGGPWFDILERKQGVYGFSYGSIGEAADIVRMLLKDENLRGEVAVRARERAKVFDSSVFERNILKIVEKIAEAKFG